ncbi:MAG: HlyD family secretion protein [Candidatus Petromonas sp.]|jgi:HlyD family secretion protein|nr:HlyD family secretion protein [Candidatus Petromonas sp.]
MQPKIKYGLFILAFLLIGFFTYVTVFSEDKDEEKKGTNYAQAQVRRGDIKVSASASGNIEASTKKNIKALENGIVDSIFVREGEFVEEGDLLMTFESDTETVEIERAKLDLRLEEDNLKELKSDLDNLKIYANTSGYIGDISAEVGDELSKGYVLSTITDNSKVEISGFLNKGQIGNIKIGDKAEVAVSEYMQVFEGKVTDIKQNPITDSTGAILYKITVEVDNPGALTEEIKGIVTVKNSKGRFSSVNESNFTIKTIDEIILKTDGELKELYIDSGDYVEKGDLLAVLENKSLQNEIDNTKILIEQKQLELTEKLKNADDLAVYAPISGTVTEISVTEGERVGENSTVAVISDLSNLQIVIPIDELDINKVEVGQKAIVTVDAVPDVVFNAEVSKIALEGEVSNGVATFDVTLSLKEMDGLKPGMSANGEISIESKKNVLLLPIEAIQQRQGRKIVLVKNDSGEPQAVQIKLGLVSEDFVEITEGLKEGDIVLYPVTSSSTQRNFPRGMGMIGIGGGGRPQRPPDGGGDSK